MHVHSQIFQGQLIEIKLVDNFWSAGRVEKKCNKKLEKNVKNIFLFKTNIKVWHSFYNHFSRVFFKNIVHKDHQSQKTHRNRRSKTISAVMSHIVMLLSWFFWQVLCFENVPDWKEIISRWLPGSSQSKNIWFDRKLHDAWFQQPLEVRTPTSSGPFLTIVRSIKLPGHYASHKNSSF